MQAVKLWQFNLCIALVTTIIFGVEGTLLWVVPACLAWFLNRDKSAHRRFGWPFGLWLFFVVLLLKAESPYI